MLRKKVLSREWMKNQIYMGKANEIAGGPPKVFRRE